MTYTLARSLLVSPSSSHPKKFELPFQDYRSIAQSLHSSEFPCLALRYKRNATTPILPKIRAQSLPDYVPDSKFYKALAGPSSFFGIPYEKVIDINESDINNACVTVSTYEFSFRPSFTALLKMGIRGVTVSDARGFGSQGGSKERQGGSEFSEDNFVAKVKLEIVVSKGQVEAVIDKIIKTSRTGEIGDGKIFLIPVADVIRVRTGERGEIAVRMTGGPASAV